MARESTRRLGLRSSTIRPRRTKLSGANDFESGDIGNEGSTNDDENYDDADEDDRLIRGVNKDINDLVRHILSSEEQNRDDRKDTLKTNLKKLARLRALQVKRERTRCCLEDDQHIHLPFGIWTKCRLLAVSSDPAAIRSTMEAEFGLVRDCTPIKDVRERMATAARKIELDGS